MWLLAKLSSGANGLMTSSAYDINSCVPSYSR